MHISQARILVIMLTFFSVFTMVNKATNPLPLPRLILILLVAMNTAYC
jgi:hypothetical protein